MAIKVQTLKVKITYKISHCSTINQEADGILSVAKESTQGQNKSIQTNIVSKADPIRNKKREMYSDLWCLKVSVQNLIEKPVGLCSGAIKNKRHTITEYVSRITMLTHESFQWVNI